MHDFVFLVQPWPFVLDNFLHALFAITLIEKKKDAELRFNTLRVLLGDLLIYREVKSFWKKLQGKIAPLLGSLLRIFQYHHFMPKLVQGEKEHSDWFPGRSEFCFTDRYR